MFVPETLRNIRHMQHIQRGPNNTFRVAHQAVRVGPDFVRARAILIRYGMTSVETGCVVAHEYMHGCLRVGSLSAAHRPHLSPKVEEGVCRLAQYLWLQARQAQVRRGTELF
ncbi:hypothetical protein ABPG75_008309 [Micractinium tetrahymenae]